MSCSTRRREQVKPQFNRRVFIEIVERRLLMSVSTTSVPDMIAHPLASSTNVASTSIASPLDTFPSGNSSPVGFTPAQIRHAYGLDSITFGSTTGNGSGQTIAIVGAFDNPKLVSSTDPNYANSDLHKFNLQFGLPDPPSFRKVNQTGGTSYPGTDPSWANEAALDVEWVHAIAPKANIILVECNSAALSDLISAGVDYARQQPGVSVVTMSFAASEASGETFFDSTLGTPAGHGGVTFVAASGDNGNPAGYPSFSPNVLSVGGTSLTLSSGSYGSETGRTESGGGQSLYESRPSFQSGINQSGSNRLNPDVAFDADPNTGVAVYDSFNGGSLPWYKVGGTSFSAPVWGAMVVIANQGRATKSLAPLDGISQTLPRLYQLNTADFHDITTGNNGSPATSGYDLVTGRGTPKANTLVAHLAGDNTVSGTMFSDTNGNGTRDSGEPAIVGWGCFLDINNNGVKDALDIRAISNSSGVYTFTDLPGGTFHINQATPNGWKRTTSAISVSLGFGSAVTGKMIGNQPLARATIAGTMFNDADGNGAIGPGEPILAGWGCFLDFNNDGVFNGSDIRATSDANGHYSFTNLSPGVTYHVRQNTPAGWRRTTPSSDPVSITLTSGQTRTLNWGNTLASISGTVFDDVNGNGAKDTGEWGLYGWGVFLDRDGNGVFSLGDTRVIADATGHYTFFDLAPGTYKINEAVPTGYRRTTPTTAGYTITVTAGQIVTGKNFGSQQV